MWWIEQKYKGKYDYQNYDQNGDDHDNHDNQNDQPVWCQMARTRRSLATSHRRWLAAPSTRAGQDTLGDSRHPVYLYLYLYLCLHLNIIIIAALPTLVPQNRLLSSVSSSGRTDSPKYHKKCPPHHLHEQMWKMTIYKMWKMTIIAFFLYLPPWLVSLHLEMKTRRAAQKAKGLPEEKKIIFCNLRISCTLKLLHQKS